jgi:hypothetical protein
LTRRLFVLSVATRKETDRVGLDLTLLPITSGIRTHPTFSHTLLGLERDSDLFGEIMAFAEANGVDVPPDFNSYMSREETECGFEEAHYGETLTDNYGDRLQYVKASDLLQFDGRPGVLESAVNRAAWAWLAEWAKASAEHDEECHVVLYW